MTDMHDTADLVSKALRRAWQLGQTYWQQADSEYQSHWKKADATQATFDQLVEATRAAILTSNSGAKAAPTALLVAAANLVAQMEIVSRVGFVDTPDDKDSCAAFCVAEGTWLELMSAIESLASALAAAPEAKRCP